MSLNKYFHYNRKAYKDGKLIHNQDTAIHATKMIGAVPTYDTNGFRMLLQKWNDQGKRPNISGIIYEYTYICTEEVAWVE